jgi:hypothetical protein
MASRYEVYSSNFVPKVGRSVLILGIIKPDGTQAIIVEWYLCVQPNSDLIKYYAPGRVDNLVDSEEMELAPYAIAEEHLIDAAMANAKIVLNRIQAKIYEETQDIESLGEVEFAPDGDGLIREMWIHGRPSARARIEQMRTATKCQELKGFLGAVVTIQDLHTT